MDHMRRGTLKLAGLKMAVLDEVDVMLNMGFRDDIETILQAAPVERQTVFFSATIPRPIQQLIEKYSRNPRAGSYRTEGAYRADRGADLLRSDPGTGRLSSSPVLSTSTT